MSELTYREAADHLNVSPATIKNWKRQGILSSDNHLNLQESEINLLKDKISTHKSSRLHSRANKSSAIGKFIPTEYIENKISRKAVNRLSLELTSFNVSHSTFLFALSILLIEKANLLDLKKIQKNGLPVINHKNLEMEIISWYKSINKPPYLNLIKKISHLQIPVQRDSSGLIYQMLQSEGRKSERGSYYTPPSFADEVLTLYGYEGQKFLDPCCGSGMFLLAAAQKYNSPYNIYGWDTDETAIRLARINMMLYFKGIQFKPNIFLRNCLTETTNEKFDLIATNPPWGNHFSKSDRIIINKKYAGINTGESFSYFIEAGLELLNKKGILSYILPEALLKVKTHRDIRMNILNRAHIKYLKYLGKPFYRVQTQVVRMDMVLNPVDQSTIVYRKNKIYSVNSRRFLKNPAYLFDFNCNQRDYNIIEHIYKKKHRTLKKNTLWILGVVTGNNNRFISDTKKDNCKLFISGLDIEAFKIKKPSRYIYFNRQILQQSASGENYEKNPKVVYKFITDKPVFAIDRSGFITLNSANSFYLPKNIQAEVVTGLFNSKLYQFIYRKKFNSLKILKSHLEQLPIPDFNHQEISLLIKLVREIETVQEINLEKLKNELNNFIFQYFNISPEDRNYILEKC